MLKLKNVSKDTIKELDENLNFIFHYGHEKQIIEIFNLLTVVSNKVKKEKNILKNVRKDIDKIFVENNINIYIDYILKNGTQEETDEMLDWLFIIKDEIIEYKNNIIRFSDVRKMYEARV